MILITEYILYQLKIFFLLALLINISDNNNIKIVIWRYSIISNQERYINASDVFN